MSLLDVIRGGVKLAHDIVKPLESDVTYVRVTARNAYGDPSTYASPVVLKGIVDFAKVPVREKDGTTTYTRATITFLDVASIVAATGGAGVSVDDVTSSYTGVDTAGLLRHKFTNE